MKGEILRFAQNDAGTMAETFAGLRARARRFTARRPEGSAPLYPQRRWCTVAIVPLLLERAARNPPLRFSAGFFHGRHPHNRTTGSLTPIENKEDKLLNPDFRFNIPKLTLILTSDANIYAVSSVNAASGGRNPVGESKNQPFQLSFNKFSRVDFQGSRVTSDGV